MTSLPVPALVARDRPRVFISNESRIHDYTNAKVWGDLVPITQGNYPIFKTMRLIEEIAESIKDSHEDDFLLLSGSSVIAALCMSMWLRKHAKCIMLLYDRRENAYVTRVIEDMTLSAWVLSEGA